MKPQKTVIIAAKKSERKMIPAEIIAVKRSQYVKSTYYVTVKTAHHGEIKLIATRNYPIGTQVNIRKKNSIDPIWVIVKE